MPNFVVFRADDAGSSPGANVAVRETVLNGVVRNVSVMVPGPYFEQAVPLLSGLTGIDFGLHVTLSAEWDHIKWGPVAAASRVPSLVDDRGHFTPAPHHLQERGFSLEQAVAEVEAQLAKGRAAGLTFHYLDEHMGVGWIDGLRDELQALCRREGLLYHGDIPYLPNGQTQDVSSLLHAIRRHAITPHVVVAHPGSDDDPVMREFTLGTIPAGQILEERAQDRRVLTDPLIIAAARSGEIRSLTYLEAAFLCIKK